MAGRLEGRTRELVLAREETEMRLRQLLGVLLVFAVCGMMAMAGASELKNVNVVPGGNGATVTLVTNGAFGHNEYRASQDLFIVDLTGGVSAGKLKDSEHKLQAPGVQSYRVGSYKGTSGEVTRIELRVEPTAEVKVTQVAGGLQINVVSKTAASAPVQNAAVPHNAASGQKPVPDAKTTPTSTKALKAAPAVDSTTEVVRIQSVAVVRGKSGLGLEVSGSGPITAKVLKLAGPDRIVLDIPNSVPGRRIAPIPVNSGDVKAVRTARYQVDPPVTRVVVDMLSPHEYDLATRGNKVVLTLRGVTEASVNPVVPKLETTQPVKPVDSVASIATAPQQEMASAAKPVITPAVYTPAKESKGGAAGGDEAKAVVIVEPTYQTKPQDKVDESQKGVATAKSTAAIQSAALQTSEASKNSASAQAATNSQDGRPQYTGEPISVNLKDVDVKDFFRLIHEISGLNVVLDPGVTGTLTLVLDDVPWDQALDIVLKNNSLDKQLQGNVLRVATIENLRKEAQAKRLQIEAEALAVPKTSVTRFLSYARAKDVVPTIKKMLSTRGDIVADERMNAIIIQDIPNVIPDIDRLIAQLDRKTQEVDIEARVVAATRSFKRDIGAMIGMGWGNGPTAVGGLPKLGSTGLNGITQVPKYFVDGNRSIPILSNLLPTQPSSGLSFINESSSYRVDVMLAAAEKRGLLKILSRPHVVTQNNIQALVKQGMRIPITTQAQLQGPPTVTYVEAVLRLTVTPQITTDSTIFLNVDIENTQPDFSTMIQGNPVFLTEQTTTQVLVSDGGTVMIGGVIQTSNSVTTDQVPFLGDVPILGNLFKHRQVNNSTQELIFIITPKIVQT